LKTVKIAAVDLVSDAIEARRIGHWQGAQQNALHEREDGGVSADAESQGDHSRRGKPRRFAQLPQRVANVLR
jgi:hypothetical protein